VVWEVTVVAGSDFRCDHSNDLEPSSYRVSHFLSDPCGVVVNQFDGHGRESIEDSFIHVAEWAFQLGKEAASK
jgi:hypothetical protein